MSFLLSFLCYLPSQLSLNDFEQTFNSATSQDLRFDFDNDGEVELETEDEAESTQTKKTSFECHWQLIMDSWSVFFKQNSVTRMSFVETLKDSGFLFKIFQPLKD